MSESTVRRMLRQLEEMLAPPPEVIIRRMLIRMLNIMRAKPGDSGADYVDGLIEEIMEPRFCGPAIAAACKETWQTQTFAPKPCELILCVPKTLSDWMP